MPIDENYNSGVNGKTPFPIVADPENIELNRLQLQYHGLPKTVVTVGRQRINLDDQRFVGSVGWRAERADFRCGAHRMGGRHEREGRHHLCLERRGPSGASTASVPVQQAIGGDNVFANLSLAARPVTLTGFAYLVDQDEPRADPQFAARPTAPASPAAMPFGDGKAELRAQLCTPERLCSAIPTPIPPNITLGDLGLEIRALRIGAGGYEVLGADNGVALTSFQTPLATLHKFQGWADKFLVTPPNGLRDAYGSIGYGWKKKGRSTRSACWPLITAIGSDRLNQHYGDEMQPPGVRQVRPLHSAGQICRLQRRSLCDRYTQGLAVTGVVDLTVKPHLIVIGNGMAGCRAVEEILARDRGSVPHHDLRRRAARELQPHHALAAARGREDASTTSSSTTTAGTPTTASTSSPAIRWWRSIARSRRSPHARAGSRATTSCCSRPAPIRSSSRCRAHDLQGVVTFRDMDDVDAMLRAASGGGDAVVIGGGLLGLEAAHGLSLRGMKVTVLHLMPTLMERQLDEAAGWLLKEALEARGQMILTGADTAEIYGKGQGRRRAAEGRARHPGRRSS